MNAPWKLLVIPVLVLTAAVPARADNDPAYDLRVAILQCTPSCYKREEFDGPAKKIKVCAYLPIIFTQEKHGSGWAALERSSAGSPKAVPGCKFPTSVPAKWRTVVAQARKQLDLAKGDFATVAPDADWGIEKDDLGRVTARDIVIDHYSRGQEAFDGCRQGDPFATCEGENNEVTSFNQAHYRVTEAKQLKKDGKDKECRIAAWEAVRQAVEAKTERARQIKNDDWKAGLTYATRYDGLLGEKEMFAKMDALETEARGLWTTCGGKGEVPPNR